MSGQFVSIDGLDYWTLLEGPEHAPLILLTHALMSSHGMWDSTVKTLNKAGYRTLIFDHIGHDKTPPPQDTSQRWSTDDIVRHMHHIVLTISSQPNLKAVIGCSIGGVLALRYAMLYPQEVDVAVSLCAPGITSLEAAKPLWSERILQFEEDVKTGDDVLCRATVERWLPGDADHDKAVRQQAYGHVKTCSLGGYKVLADAIRNYDYSDQLRDLNDVRCFIIAGGRDTAVDSNLLKDVAGSIPKARFVLMENAGHLPPMHRADDFEELLLEFLHED